MLRSRRQARITSRKGVFNPEDKVRVKHTKIGVWDLYEEKEPELANIPGALPLTERVLTLRRSLPYLWRMMKEIGSIRSCWTLLMFYLTLVVLSAMIPAVAIWCVCYRHEWPLGLGLTQSHRQKGQLLTVVSVPCVPVSGSSKADQGSHVRFKFLLTHAQ